MEGHHFITWILKEMHNLIKIKRGETTLQKVVGTEEKLECNPERRGSGSKFKLCFIHKFYILKNGFPVWVFRVNTSLTTQR